MADLGPPNVVIILADDMGWGDLGSYGNRTIRTPNIDRLASEGARFTSFYVPTPICSASRAGLLTGRFPGRVGIPWNPPNRLNRGEVVLASVLRDRGYATGMVGKWHLGWEKKRCRSTTASTTSTAWPRARTRATSSSGTRRRATPSRRTSWRAATPSWP